jgi:hypothetical protein
MSSIRIEDIGTATALDRTAMAGLVGGMEVRIEKVSSTAQNADDGTLVDPAVLGAVVSSVINALGLRRYAG